VLNTWQPPWQPAQGRLLGRPSGTGRALPNPG
jgi:hypothetical protein